ncbi:rRNA maturation RNase YbeY [Persicirhabdus sediminis]|uniref:Endoribonuclease YbeY n=1 Tax=Persicirhabdus sediminis TaxID=454144 RepID=A0A8J7MD79_9BACT|nr:rRNA maturation RNase YbeY [Persicirhabdus sediminis]MBK1791252.1 rRNA maturation RNase YbeY [Persicirhabdus sediminis]
MNTQVEIYQNQDKLPLSESLIERMTAAANAAIPLVSKLAVDGEVLSQLELVEVSIVDDETIAQVHVDFMDIPGATDVITFDYGEIVVSVETAKSQALEYGNEFERELMLYVIHGLMHLAGHEDADPAEAAVMAQGQESVLAEVW